VRSLRRKVDQKGKKKEKNLQGGMGRKGKHKNWRFEKVMATRTREASGGVDG